jgi:DNA-binding HxlR family transcriptional regulator
MQMTLVKVPRRIEHQTDAGCRVDPFLKILAREWTSHIVWALGRKPSIRFGALRRALPGAISARVLSARLKELESLGLIVRHDKGKLPLHVEYSLTDEGRRLDAELRRSEGLTGRLRMRAAAGEARPSNQSHKPKVQSARSLRPA